MSTSKALITENHTEYPSILTDCEGDYVAVISVGPLKESFTLIGLRIVKEN